MSEYLRWVIVGLATIGITIGPRILYNDFEGKSSEELNPQETSKISKVRNLISDPLYSRFIRKGYESSFQAAQYLIYSQNLEAVCHGARLRIELSSVATDVKKARLTEISEVCDMSLPE